VSAFGELRRICGLPIPGVVDSAMAPAPAPAES